jgi:hypothetical protein
MVVDQIAGKQKARAVTIAPLASAGRQYLMSQSGVNGRKREGQTTNNSPFPSAEKFRKMCGADRSEADDCARFIGLSSLKFFRVSAFIVSGWVCKLQSEANGEGVFACSHICPLAGEFERKAQVLGRIHGSLLTSHISLLISLIVFDAFYNVPHLLNRIRWTFLVNHCVAIWTNGA